MQEVIVLYLFIWLIQFTGMLFFSVSYYIFDKKEIAKELAIDGLIGPIPSILFYYYKLFK